MSTNLHFTYMKRSGIYRLTLPNGAAYIGQSSNLDRRLYAHKRDLYRGRHHNLALQECALKFGVDSVAFDVLEELPADRELLAQREAYWVDALHPSLNIKRPHESGLGSRSNAIRPDEYRLGTGAVEAVDAINSMRGSVRVKERPVTQKRRKRNPYISKGKDLTWLDIYRIEPVNEK